ncbi:MAG TPA: MG2 domain-containing protein [Candidatus Methylomirabilis sp.]|nr:MG2 domain-containing protein [Candidatus Methylomirabilis sp.]
MRAIRSLILILSLLCLATPVPAQAAETQVTAFSPGGTVKRVRQAQAVFSAPMVPFGDLRLADPFDVTCPETGLGRWVDMRTWVYDFARDLPGGLRCVFTLRPGLQSLDGQPVSGPATFAFSTGGPAIRASQPREGADAIDEGQAFVLELDAPATPASVERHAGFKVDSLPDRIGLRILTGDSREAILRARYGQRPRPDGVLVVQARQRFPTKARVTLLWSKGVASLGGVPTDDDQALAFEVRGPFTLRFECLRENPRAACVPVSPMRVAFGTRVAWSDAQRMTLVGPGGRRWSAARDGEDGPLVNGVIFRGPFPEKATFSLEIPSGLTDDAGRVPVNAASFPLAVKTEAFPPLAKFAARFGILERYADPALPVTLRNVEPTLPVTMLGLPSGPTGLSEWMKGKVLRVSPDRAGEILPWLMRLASADRETSMFGSVPAGVTVKTFGLPKPHGSEPMEVVGIPLKAPGFYLVEIESARLGVALLGKPKPMFVPAGSLVTNLAVHLKWGRTSSLVWVTTLDKARPVSSAQVTVFDCNNRPLWKGVTDRLGIARPTGLPTRDAAPQCQIRYAEGNETIGYLGGGLFVTAQTPDDLSFVHSSWEQGIEPWRFNLPTYDVQGPVNVQTVLDRPLYRAGETVSMKHVIRRQELRGLVVPGPAGRPARLTIRHQGSDQEYELPLSWDAAGIAEGVWSIPKGAKLGRYQIEVDVPMEGASQPGQTVTLTSATFRVEEFRVPLMRATLKAPAEPLVAVSEFPLDISVQYLAGGGAAKQPVTVRAQLSPRALPTFDLFEDFTFANGALAPGIVRKGGGESEYEEEEPADEAVPRASRAAQGVHQRTDVTLDAAGTARVSISKLPRSPVPQDVLAEAEFRDPNGEVVTAATRVPLWPAAWLVGVRPESWAASRDDVRVMAAVVDLTGKPVARVPVQIEVLEKKAYANRKRLVGGFYAYEYVQEVKRVGELCRGVTDQRGLMPCGGKTSASGQLILQARIQDEQGHPIAAHQEVWVAGSDEWWFEVRDSDRIDLLPERRRYEPGETATLQVRMPFREATALVTVEREGVLDAFVAPLSGREPVVKLPIKGDHAPNIFVSAFVVRGRVGAVQPTALVDLGRPAHKLGITELRVGWRAYELKVAVTPDRQVYQVREKARVKIRARTAGGAAPPAGSEVALAAVDEGLLELARNPSWDLLENMMRRRAYLVATSTAQGQVVGKRHFGLKALPQGGGGGRQTTRELFETLLLWKARVPLDGEGEATVEVPLNDSLTSFRIVAVATGGAAFFGTGRASIRSTRDLMVLPGIAPLARQGDRMRPEVTVRNTTARPLEVTVTAKAQGLKEALAPQTLMLPSGEARVIGWSVTVPAGVSAIKWEIDAVAKSGPADRVRATQQVIDAVPVRTFQATLVQLDRAMREPVERPADALAGRGDIRVQLRPSLVDGMGGVRDWMREYAYHCLEQDVSRAIALRDRERWRALMAELPSYQDGDGLLKYFPTMDQGNEALTSYVLAVAGEASWSIPAGPRGRMEQGLKKFVTGTITRRQELPTADLSIRKLQAVEALSRYGKAEVGLLGSIAIEPGLWPTSAVLDWWSLLSRMPGVPDHARRMAEAEQIVRARVQMQGTVMTFSTESSDGLWWLMVSPDVNAVRLILHLVRTGQWQTDVPRLMAGALARQRRGAWGLTVANAWGVLAVEKFSAAYEKTPVTGATTAALGSTSRSVNWARTPKGTSLVFPWPPGRDEVVIDQTGTGKPWITLEARAAIPLRAPLSSGYVITRTVTAVEQKQTGVWSRGDIARVRLEIEGSSDMTWVVINDPIPAGASILGSGLGGQSRIALTGQDRSGCPCAAFEERASDGVRAYYPYVRKGPWTYEYTIRLNESGRFLLPPTRVEALYAPGVFGELPNAPFEVRP